ncbi:DUF2637 domain-containing protein [Phytoactinopolyspora alkaliphila]|uniref:DUF2637 domain-containing protein n=1 Tax=Phytoactinopolyspora alkaliphila TaxID=1783498 RepID=A0A6N9YPJ0_9ACTN|nr:DUF2637 domain-containing protein [Phytoactinopolyspora alkaliphila]NED96850.1 DUF2637 domain-containing protein [Phytoactinopolyspora alkaliphila]
MNDVERDHEESAHRHSLAIPRRVLVSLAIAVALLAIAAFTLSFDALRDLALIAGLNRRLVWLWPIVVDGFIVIATIAAVLLRPRGWKVAWYPWFTLMLAAAVSVWGNALHAATHADLNRVTLVVAALVSAVPALSLLLASHLLVVLLAPPESVRAVRVVRNAHTTEATLNSAHSDDHGASHSNTHARATTRRSSDHGRQHARRAISTRKPTNEELRAWVNEELRGGRAVTGVTVGERFRVSGATGRRWLKSLRATAQDRSQSSPTPNEVAGAPRGGSGSGSNGLGAE